MCSGELMLMQRLWRRCWTRAAKYRQSVALRLLLVASGLRGSVQVTSALCDVTLGPTPHNEEDACYDDTCYPLEMLSIGSVVGKSPLYDVTKG